MNNKLINDVTDMMNLYKDKETDHKTNLLIYTNRDNPNERIISINYGDNYFNKTDFSTENVVEFDNKIIFDLITSFKTNDYSKEDHLSFLSENNCTYQCTLNSGRKIIVEKMNFSLINKIKLLLTGTTYQLADFTPNKKRAGLFSDSVESHGFSNYLLLVVMMLFLLDMILIVLILAKRFV